MGLLEKNNFKHILPKISSTNLIQKLVVVVVVAALFLYYLYSKRMDLTLNRALKGFGEGKVEKIDLRSILPFEYDDIYYFRISPDAAKKYLNSIGYNYDYPKRIKTENLKSFVLFFKDSAIAYERYYMSTHLWDDGESIYYQGYVEFLPAKSSKNGVLHLTQSFFNIKHVFYKTERNMQIDYYILYP